MKLATFTEGGSTRIGVVRDGGIVDLSVAVPDLPRDMIALISSEAAMAKARAAAEEASTIPLDKVTLEAPIPFPGKVLAIGLNYRDHVAETGRTETANPALFPRYPASQVGHGQPDRRAEDAQHQ